MKSIIGLRGGSSRVRSHVLASLLLLSTAGALADDYSASWGPQVGASIPVLSAQDQSGAPRNLENLVGEQGLLLFLVRSADW